MTPGVVYCADEFLQWLEFICDEDEDLDELFALADEGSQALELHERIYALYDPEDRRVFGLWTDKKLSTYAHEGWYIALLTYHEEDLPPLQLNRFYAPSQYLKAMESYKAPELPKKTVLRQLGELLGVCDDGTELPSEPKRRPAKPKGGDLKNDKWPSANVEKRVTPEGVFYTVEGLRPDVLKWIAHTNALYPRPTYHWKVTHYEPDGDRLRTVRTRSLSDEEKAALKKRK